MYVQGGMSTLRGRTCSSRISAMRRTVGVAAWRTRRTDELFVPRHERGRYAYGTAAKFSPDLLDRFSPTSGELAALICDRLCRMYGRAGVSARVLQHVQLTDAALSLYAGPFLPVDSACYCTVSRVQGYGMHKLRATRRGRVQSRRGNVLELISSLDSLPQDWGFRGEQKVLRLRHECKW